MRLHTNEAVFPQRFGCGHRTF